MYFAQYGSGDQVLVGFHGWSGDHRTFLPLADRLPKGVTLLSADLPGIGKSAPPDQWNMGALVRKIGNELVARKIPSLTLIGSCSGGLIGLFVVKYLLENHQEKLIKQLLLIDPFAYFPWYFNVFVSPRMGKVGWYAYCTTFANPIGRFITNLSLRKHRQDNSNLTESFTQIDHRITHQYLKLLAESGSAEQFSNINIPVTIIYGENTFSAVRASLTQWKRIMPNVSIRKMKQVGHLPLVEAPDKLAEIVFHGAS